MNRAKLIKHLAKNSEVDKEDVERVINELEFTIIKTIAAGESIKMFSGFELQPKEVKAHRGRNPITGEMELFPASYGCRLHTTRTFKEKVGIYRDQDK